MFTNNHIQHLQTLAMQQAARGISCVVLLPSSCNDSSTHHSAIMVKSQQWPTPRESIAIYGVKETSFVCDTLYTNYFNSWCGHYARL